MKTTRSLPPDTLVDFLLDLETKVEIPKEITEWIEYEIGHGKHESGSCYEW